MALLITGCCASSAEVRLLESRGGYFIPRNEGFFVNCDVERIGFHDHGQITDEVLAELAPVLIALEPAWLDLSGQPLTDASIPVLNRIAGAGVRSISVVGTRMTPEGIKQLPEAARRKRSG